MFRLVALVFVAVFLTLANMGEVMAQRSSSAPRILKFDAFRNGDRFGFTMARVDGDLGQETVEAVTVLRVGFGPITLFKYLVRTSGQWRDGKLLSLDAAVNDDGDVFRVTARADGERLIATGGDGQIDIPSATLPSTYWRRDIVERGQVLSTQHGRLLNYTVENLGRETIDFEGEKIEATRYALRGDLDIDLWYDQRDQWVGMAFTVGDSNIVYRRVKPKPEDLDAFIPVDSLGDISNATVHEMVERH